MGGAGIRRWGGQGVFSPSHMGCVLLETWDPDKSICLSLSVAPLFSVQGRRGHYRDFSPLHCLPKRKKTPISNTGDLRRNAGSQHLMSLVHLEVNYELPMPRKGRQDQASWRLPGRKKGRERICCVLLNPCSLYYSI